jgi:hypothetical protein
LLTITQAAEIKRLALEANKADARAGLIPRHCTDPAVLARVVSVIRSTTEGTSRMAENDEGRPRPESGPPLAARTF